jgi:ribonuclease VapC
MEGQEARDLLARLQQTSTRLTSPLAEWEAAIAIARHLDLSISEATEAFESYLMLMDIEMTAVPPGTAQIALDATGTGRAGTLRVSIWGLVRLCLRQHFGQALTFNGADFAHTDIEAA